MPYVLPSIVTGFCIAAMSSSTSAIGSAQFKPNTSFARTVKIAFTKENPSYSVSEDACMQAGKAEMDCLLVGKGPKGAACFEIAWSSGGPAVAQFACGAVIAALRKDTKPGWVIHYKPAYSA